MVIASVEPIIGRHKHHCSIASASQKDTVNVFSQCERISKHSASTPRMLHGPVFFRPEEIGAPGDQGTIKLEPLRRELGSHGIELAARLRVSRVVVVPGTHAKSLRRLEGVVYAEVWKPFIL